MKDRALNNVFSILIKKKNNILIHLGTGFLIGKNGLFFTVGHTFRKIENEINENRLQNIFIAFPSNQSKLYSIVSLWYESFDIYLQKGPTYKDTAVGIVDYRNDDYFVFNRKRPKIGDVLTSYGYLNTKEDRQHLMTNGIADLSEVKFKDTEVIVSKYNALISDLRSDFETPRNCRFFNNCITIDKKLIIGESGCPLIDSNGLVSGVMFGSPCIATTSDIILAKYCTKAIKYRTYYSHDMYEDLKFR